MKIWVEYGDFCLSMLWFPVAKDAGCCDFYPDIFQLCIQNKFCQGSIYMHMEHGQITEISAGKICGWTGKTQKNRGALLNLLKM